MTRLKLLSFLNVTHFSPTLPHHAKVIIKHEWFHITFSSEKQLGKMCVRVGFFFQHKCCMTILVSSYFHMVCVKGIYTLQTGLFIYFLICTDLIWFLCVWVFVCMCRFSPPYLLSALSISMTTSTERAMVMGFGWLKMSQWMPANISSCSRHWDWWVWAFIGQRSKINGRWTTRGGIAENRGAIMTGGCQW